MDFLPWYSSFITYIFWRLNFEDFQNSPKLSVNDANVSNNGGEANRLAISKDETLNTLQFYGKSYDFDG